MKEFKFAKAVAAAIIVCMMIVATHFVAYIFPVGNLSHGDQVTRGLAILALLLIVSDWID